MKMFNSRSSILVGLGSAAFMLAAIGCSSSSSSNDGSATGGTSAEGGKGGSGGTSATGGSGGAAAPALSFTFDSSVQNWAINTYHDLNSTNLGFELAPDAGIDASVVPTLTHDATDGSPATPAGCLKLTATFTGYNQYIDVKVGISPTVSLSGMKMHAQVQLASATGGTFPGGAILETDTTAAYTYGGSTGTSLTVGTWTPLVLDLNTVSTAGYDDTMVIQVGVQFYSGSAPTDGGTALGPIEATFLIDTVQAL